MDISYIFLILLVTFSAALFYIMFLHDYLKRMVFLVKSYFKLRSIAKKIKIQDKETGEEVEKMSKHLIKDLIKEEKL